ALHASSAPPEPLDLVGPDMPTQAEYLRRRNAARDERVVALYVRAAPLLRRIAAVERVRTARALAYRLAWATQSVRYDVGPLGRALGWCPSINLSHGLPPRLVPAPAGALAPSAPATAPTPSP